MTGPLEGYRVIDLTRMIAGPVATMTLGDQGAEIIKVEPPDGDIVRGVGSNRDGFTSTFLSANRSKKSIAIDLKRADGLALLERLVASADVFVENFRPGTTERMGIGEPSLRRIKPDLVYVSISGFGEHGPYAHKRVYDPVIQALCGLADIQGDRERPRMVRTIIPDKLTAITAAQAITAALLHRERTGEGQHLKLAMLDAMIAFLWPEGLVNLTLMGGEVKESRAKLAPDLVYRTRDGFITVGAVSDSEWSGLCAALEKPEWLDDPRFNTPHGRSANAPQRLRQTQEVLETRSSAEWLERLDANQVPCAPVLTQATLLEHPQIQASDIVHEHEHPVAGRYRQPRPAPRFGASPAEMRRHAPSLGEHTRELLEALGHAPEEIEALYASRTVR